MNNAATLLAQIWPMIAWILGQLSEAIDRSLVSDNFCMLYKFVTDKKSFNFYTRKWGGYGQNLGAF